jgi:hypothetical protein
MLYHLVAKTYIKNNKKKMKKEDLIKISYN